MQIFKKIPIDTNSGNDTNNDADEHVTSVKGDDDEDEGCSSYDGSDGSADDSSLLTIHQTSPTPKERFGECFWPLFPRPSNQGGRQFQPASVSQQTNIFGFQV